MGSKREKRKRRKWCLRLWIGRILQLWFAVGVLSWFMVSVPAWFTVSVPAWFTVSVPAWFTASVPAVYAAELNTQEERVFDYAGLFDRGEKQKLEDTAQKLREEMHAEMIVLTIEDAGGRQAQEVADGFYIGNGFHESFHENGMVILIDMDNRELYLGTYGDMIRVLTDQRLDQILDLMYTEAADGRYAEAAVIGLTESGQYFRKGIVSGQYNYDVETGRISVHHTIRWYEALAAVMLGGIAAGGACLNVRRRYRMRAGSEAESRRAYQEQCAFQFQEHTDRLIDTVISHTVIARSSSLGSRGSSSGRRSSTHSHGGHTAGGRGRKF